MVSILFDLLFTEKSSTAPYKSCKKFLLGIQGIKKNQNFALISKMCRSLVFGKKDLENFAKYRFYKIKSSGTS